MIRIYLAAIDIVPAAVVLVPLFLLLHKTVYNRNLRKTVRYCLFCLYLSAVMSLVGIPNVTYFRPDVNLNLIPFRGLIAELKNCILNVALFVPLGLFLPMLWQKYRTLKYTAGFGFCLSLFIELIQMLTFRATDVNDLITNVLGTLTGFFLAMPIVAKKPAAGERSRDAFILLSLSFGVMFFIHPFLSPLIWDRIL